MQVLRLDEAVVVRERLALGVGQGLLELGGQLVDSHGGFEGSFACMKMTPPGADFKRPKRELSPREV